MNSDQTTVSWVFCVRHIVLCPVLAMTATANQQDRKYIMESLGLKECQNIVGDLNRKNILYKKVFRQGQDLDAFEGILRPIAMNLLEYKIQHPLTIGDYASLFTDAV